MNRLLWVVQVLLALVFLFAGASKLIMSVAEMTKQMPHPLPRWFLRFLGVAEVAGAVGLIVPGLTRILPGLTPLAAVLLAFITVSATIITLAGGMGAIAMFPFVVAALSAFVAYGRSRVAPIAARQ